MEDREGQGPDPDDSGPKTTRPDTISRRAPDTISPIGSQAERKLDAVPDRVDIRDWFYRPGLAPIPDLVCNCSRVPAILDQQKEGACTGFALAAVINYLLHARNSEVRVSPQMLYEMARRYDDWPGEGYEGSSARGAMKGWMRHGVCSDALWPVTLKIKVAALSAPGRTLLLHSRSLLVGEVLRNRKLLSRQAQRARVAHNDRANHMFGVGGPKPAGDASTNVTAVSAIS